jgi:hypothetical protein
MGVGFRNDPVSGLEPGNSLPNFAYLAGKFVTQHYRRPIGEFIVVDMQIRSAHAGGAYPYQHLVIVFDFWDRDIPYLNTAFPLCGFYQRLHVRSPP